MRARRRLHRVGLTAAVALIPMFSGAAELPRPGASSAEVRTALGPPTSIRKSAGKSQIWEYAGKPSAYETYFLVFSNHGKLENIRQVVSDETFSQVKPGMTNGQVRALLGTPWRITDWDDDADSDIGEMLDYRGHDGGGTYKFHIELDKHGRVVVAAKLRDIAANNRNGGDTAQSVEAKGPKP